MRYKITFFDFWHVGSGTSAGVELDAVVIKDSDNLPYLPGKTLKGLTRQNAEILDTQKAKKVFGEEGKNMARSYFSDATLDAATHAYLCSKKVLQKQLYDKVTSTKINDNGVAEDKTLREIEVVVPLTLYGEIETNEEAFIRDALMMIKQIGLNRNRGLGRCQVEVL